MIAIGKVNPVITVDRQEFKNKNTIATVRNAPSMRVCLTLATDTRMGRALSPMAVTLIPGG